MVYSDVEYFDADDRTKKITTVVLEDGSSFTLDDFIRVFKSRLKTLFAGEIVSYEDYRSYDSHISSEGMEKHLDVVEAEGLISSIKVPKLTKGQMIGVGMIIILVFVALIAMFFLKSMGIFGG